MISGLFLAAALAGGWVSESRFQLYVPAGYAKHEKHPLLVAIHGCLQSPADFAGLARLAKLADKERILVLLPSQTAEANPMRCWNWFVPENQRRDAGEPALIKGMVDWVEARYSVDRSRVYVAGISAGGYLTSTLMSCYSDLFAAGMVASGGMYEAAGNVKGGLDAMVHGSDRDPKASARDAYQCSRPVHARLVPLLVVQGTDDPYVGTRSGQQVVEQFVQLNDLGDDGEDNDSIVELSRHSETSNGGLTYSWTDYGTASTVLIRHYVVKGMGHGWSGADPGLPYAEPKGPDETAIMWKFFEAFRRR